MHSIAFIGGGNMAGAIIGGLLKTGMAATSIQVVEPFDATAQVLRTSTGVRVHARANEALKEASLVVWAVKPQMFKAAAADTAAYVERALHLSVAAGIRSQSIAAWLGSERVVRAMPNTPALVGLGMTGLFARDAVSAPDRTAIEAVLHPTGELMWLQAEAQLDAVTALSGSGPAYVFLFLEALAQAGSDLGLSETQARTLAIQTFVGASSLAAESTESLALLRERVTSKGGTTFAAITHLQAAGVGASIQAAVAAACARATELGNEFGA